MSRIHTRTLYLPLAHSRFSLHIDTIAASDAHLQCPSIDKQHVRTRVLPLPSVGYGCIPFAELLLHFFFLFLWHEVESLPRRSSLKRGEVFHADSTSERSIFSLVVLVASSRAGASASAKILQNCNPTKTGGSEWYQWSSKTFLLVYSNYSFCVNLGANQG